jgi:heme-degrading monooxygenase HmoA
LKSRVQCVGKGFINPHRSPLDHVSRTPNLTIALLNVRVGLEREFEAAFAQASLIIASMPGYISHQLQRCIETSNRYALLVNWTSIEAHTIGFRGSPEYQRWKQLLHHFYDPFPTVEHYALAAQGAA